MAATLQYLSTNHDSSARQKLVKPFRSLFVIKSISSNDRSGMYRNMIPDNGMVIYGYVRMYHTVLTDNDVISDKYIWLNDRTFSNRNKLCV